VKTILIAGGTGLVGGHIVRHPKLSERSSTVEQGEFQIVALLRRPTKDMPTYVKQVIVDYDKGVDGIKKALEDCHVDVIICAIGSTLRAAGSKEAFSKIEKDIPLALLRYGQTLTTKPQYVFVSSLGADKPFGFYLETKHAVEEEIMTSQLPYVIARPSLLLGERTEKRIGEQFAQKLMPGFFDLLAITPVKHAVWFSRYRPVSAKAVAARIVSQVSSDDSPFQVILEGEDFLE